MTAKRYSAEDIEVLEGLEPVRKRPGMYIAGTDTPAGLHQLVFEILDNSVDEAMNGHADTIRVTLHKDGCSASIEDNGRGIPVDTHPKFKKSALELILTTLHAGGKFSDKNYKTAGGLHGVGSSVVNALSVEMRATIKRDGQEYVQSFSRGVPQGPVKVVKKSIKGTGTTIFFRPDPEIFPTTEFSAKTIREALRTKAYLNPGLRLCFIDQCAETEEEFFYQEGLRAYLRQLLSERKAKCIVDEPFVIEKNDSVAVSMSLVWTESTKEEFYCYVNGIYTPDGGSHEVGAKSGIVKAIRNYIGIHDLEPKGVKISAEDIREGLVCLVSVKLPGEEYQPQFQGQTKSKLNNPEITPLVDSAARGLEQLLNETPTAARAIVNRIVLAAKARAASRAAGQSVRRKIGVSHRLTLPGKLADCSSNKTEDTELFIVEGDSAGGSAKQGRNREYQAVLPLRGKVLNTISSGNKKKVSDNRELSNIVSALGCGVGPDMQLDKLRYGKTIILTDADADGMHIATLLLAFFFMHMRPLIEAGNLYIGRPPLFGVFPKNAPIAQSARKGLSRAKASRAASSTAHWAYSDEELQTILKKQKLTNPRITRYKGLGEMNPDTLWSTTLDPDQRTLLRISIDDEQLVDQSLTALMGSDPSTRYQLICDNAEVIEVDV
jgi:DNA gyrase/topoisomerase IV subunit B